MLRSVLRFELNSTTEVGRAVVEVTVSVRVRLVIESVTEPPREVAFAPTFAASPFWHNSSSARLVFALC